MFPPPNTDARHIVVISRNQFYWFDAVFFLIFFFLFDETVRQMTKDGKNVGVSEDIIAENLRMILEDSVSEYLTQFLFP